MAIQLIKQSPSNAPNQFVISKTATPETFPGVLLAFLIIIMCVNWFFSQRRVVKNSVSPTRNA